jgi:hypothetical protein
VRVYFLSSVGRSVCVCVCVCAACLFLLFLSSVCLQHTCSPRVLFARLTMETRHRIASLTLVRRSVQWSTWNETVPPREPLSIRFTVGSPTCGVRILSSLFSAQVSQSVSGCGSRVGGILVECSSAGLEMVVSSSLCSSREELYRCVCEYRWPSSVCLSTYLWIGVCAAPPSPINMACGIRTVIVFRMLSGCLCRAPVGCSPCAGRSGCRSLWQS